MKAKEGVLDLLNTALTIELTAISQYFLAAKQCESWGFAGLHDHFRRLSMAEMKDTEQLVQHILYLDGLPNLQRLYSVKVGQTVPELLQAGLDSERAAVEHLRASIEQCARVGDFHDPRQA